MVIYELSLFIDTDIYPQFQSWLQEHAREMLQFPGFINATILKEKQGNKTEQEELTVQYLLESRDALEMYLTQFAPSMREKGIKLFANKFSAQRRVFEVQHTISK